MSYLTKVTSSAINTLKNRIVTAMGYNVVSAAEVSPAGIDCPPTTGMLAVYMETAKRNSPVFIGYVNNNLLANPGERRIFATDASGNEVSRIYLTNDGKINIGGTGATANPNNAVQYQALNTALNTYFNNLTIAITTGVASAGGTYTPPPAPFDMSLSKENTILLP